MNLGEMLLGGREMVDCVDEQRGWVLYIGGTQQYRPTRVTYAGRQDSFSGVAVVLRQRSRVVRLGKGEQVSSRTSRCGYPGVNS